MLQDVVGEGGEVEAGLVGVAEPGTAGHGQHALARVHLHAEQLHRTRAKVPTCTYEWLHGHDTF